MAVWLQPILPLFYASVLGLNKEFIGLIEGSLTTVVSLTRIGAGYLSDPIGRRKALVFAGYGLSALGRFLLGFAGSATAVFTLRLGDGKARRPGRTPCDDRMGLGGYGSAKALVGELVPDANRGVAYGLYNAAAGVMALPASIGVGFVPQLRTTADG